MQTPSLFGDDYQRPTVAELRHASLALAPVEATALNWSCVVNLAPHGKGRPKACIRGTHASVYTPRASAEWEHFAAEQMRRAWKEEPLAVPVQLEVVAVFERTQTLLTRSKRTGAYKFGEGRLWQTSKPDADNIAKSVCDALEKAGVLLDDRCIARVVCEKVYARIGERPHVEVALTDAPRGPGWPS